MSSRAGECISLLATDPSRVLREVATTVFTGRLYLKEGSLRFAHGTGGRTGLLPRSVNGPVKLDGPRKNPCGAGPIRSALGTSGASR